MAKQVQEIFDTHCHFWDLQQHSYPWPTPDLSIYKNHLPEDLWQEKSDLPLSGAVFVQCLNNSIEEAVWVSNLAKSQKWIRGIVAGLDPADDKFEDNLLKMQSSVPELVGIRHILDLEDKNYLSENMEKIAENINLLHRYNLTFDFLLRPHHLDDALKLASKINDTKIVIDHIAKPYIKDATIDPWKEQMTELAKYPNIYCKLSGMVTEASASWTVADIKPYAEHVLEVFGPNRVMYGSDWPVCKLADASYPRVYSTLSELLSSCSQEDFMKVVSKNGKKFYNIAH